MDEAPSAAVGELHARQVPQVVVGVFNDAPERIDDPGDLAVWVILPLCDPTIGGQPTRSDDRPHHNDAPTSRHPV